MVSFVFRVIERNPRHTRVSVFAGTRAGSRGHSGVLVFRTEEWRALEDILRGDKPPLDVVLQDATVGEEVHT
jgi:hypothetical protein